MFRRTEDQRQPSHLQNAMAGRSSIEPAIGPRQGKALSGRTSDHRPKEIGRDIEVTYMPNPRVKPQKNRAEDYSYTVAWSDEDDAFVARVTEFPSLAAHGKSQEKALRELRGVVGYVLEDLAESREPIPEPLARRNYSGKLNLRMSKELHRRLALESTTQGVSLNALINTKLARS